MNEKERDEPWYMNPWVYILIAPFAIGSVQAILGVLFEYIVAKPVENEPPIAIFQRMGSLLARAVPWVIGAFLLLWLAKSIVQESGRARWTALWEWIAGLKFRSPVTTGKQRRVLARTAAEQRRDLKRLKFDEGYAKRDDEVVAERASVRKPDWEIRPSEHRGQVSYYLYNYAYPASKVRLTAPSEYFDFGGVIRDSRTRSRARLAADTQGSTLKGSPQIKA